MLRSGGNKRKRGAGPGRQVVSSSGGRGRVPGGEAKRSRTEAPGARSRRGSRPPGTGGRGAGKRGRRPARPRPVHRDEDVDDDSNSLPATGGHGDEDGLEEAGLEGLVDFGLGRHKRGEGDDEQEDEGDEGDEAEQVDDVLLSDGDEEEAGDVSLHKQQLEELKEQDPEFYQYLLENDSRLLEFGQDAEEDDEDDEGDDEENDDQEERKASAAQATSKAEPQGKLLTFDELKKWQASALQGSLYGLKRLAVALHSACGANDEDKKKKRPTKSELATGSNENDASAIRMEPLAVGGVRIDSPEMLNSLLFFCIRQVPNIFDTYLGFKYEAPGDDNKGGSGLPKACRKWRSLEKIATSFAGSFLKLTTQITEPKPLAYLLRHLLPFMPYVASFPRYPIHYLRSLLQIWSRGDETDRIMAFLNIHRLAIAAPFPFVHRCMKESYLAYVRNAKFGTGMQRGAVNFMANGVVELFLLDGVGAYQLAFVYIRQLAVHLRQALTQKSPEAHKTVYNWQFINCLRVWSRLLCQKGGKGQDLEQLVYPYIHLVLGVIRLQPTPRFYPLRFICLRFLVELAEAIHIFIPVAPYLLEVLEWPGFAKGPHPSTAKPRPVVFQAILKAGPTTMASTTFINGVVEEVTALLCSWLRIHSHSVAFSELTLSITLSIKKFIQSHRRASCPSPAVLKRLSNIVQKIEENKQWIERLRSMLSVGPKELAQSSTILGAGRKSPFDLYTPPAASIPQGNEVSDKSARKDKQGIKRQRKDDDDAQQDGADSAEDSDSEGEEEDEYAAEGDDDLVTLVDPSEF